MSDTVPGKVVVTRSEIDSIIEMIEEVLARMQAILERPEPRPVEKDAKGWPKLGWEAHDDPEQQP